MLFRFRYLVHSIIFALGLWAPFGRLFEAVSPGNSFSSGHQSTWLILAAVLSRFGLFSFATATVLLLALGIACASAAALLRTWASAYLGARIVADGGMQGSSMVVSGPFRHLRNPLYLGTLLHAVALALLMPPAGALFSLLATAWLQAALIAGEERFLAGSLGPAYAAYRAAVPRIVPAWKPRIARPKAKAHWGSAMTGEVYMIGVAFAFAIFGWRYNAPLLIECTVISFGLSLIARAFLPSVAAREGTGDEPATHTGS